MLVKDLVKKTLIKIQKDGLTVTPDVYAKTFCIEAKKAGLNLKECTPALKYIERLDQKTALEAGNRNITSLDELIVFLIGLRQRERRQPLDQKAYSKKDNDIEEIGDILIQSLSPSFTKKIVQKLKDISLLIKKDPSVMLDLKGDILNLIYERIDFDREDILYHTNELENKINNIIFSLSALIDLGDSKGQTVKELQEALTSMDKDNLSEEKFFTIKDKLTKVANSLDQEIVQMVNELKEKKDEVSILKDRVEALQKALEDAKKESMEDFLTGVLTKRALILELKKLDNLYQRKQENYSLIFLDLDHFKKVNDTYGHDAGDLVLKAFGKTVKENVRISDYVGRYGGEEFLVLLPGYNKDEARGFGEKIRRVIEQSKIIYKGEQINLTLSGGVSDRDEATSGEDIIKIADERLYKAKESGRNKIL